MAKKVIEPKKTAPPEESSKNRRKSRRVPKKIRVEVQGNRAVFSGETIDISTTGVKVRITDGSFFSDDVLTNPELCLQKIEEEFGFGIGIYFPGLKETYTGLLSRLKNEERDENDMFILACNFNHEMDADTFMKLECLDEVGDGKKAKKPSMNEEDETDMRREKVVDRRRAVRVRTSHRVEVYGDCKTFKARAVNISSTGVLIDISDSELGVSYGPERIIALNQIMTDQFRKGLVVRFLDGEFSIQADAVRVSEITCEGNQLTVIGCRFRRALTPEECAFLEIDPDSFVTIKESKPEGTVAEVPADVGSTNIRTLMKQAMEKSATDLHIKVGSPPRMRIAGTLLDIGSERIEPQQAHDMARDLMTSAQATDFELEGDVELACSIEDGGRFRVNIFRQRGYTGLAVRCIQTEIPTIESLGLHPLAKKLAEKPHGLVLVTGPTGSGKSTTLAAMVDHINRTRACHVITMEDPIEYIQEDLKAQITQREMGHDVPDFAKALKRALRQDPDVLMVGEMRDLETIALALTAAETGHLVFATLHTTSAIQTPARIVDVFPPDQQTQIRLQLADSLQGVMAQILVPRKDGEGMVLAQEVLVANDAARALIRENKTHQIANVMQTSGKEGMQTMEKALNRLVKEKVISYEVAVSKANIPKQIRKGTSPAKTSKK